MQTTTTITTVPETDKITDSGTGATVEIMVKAMANGVKTTVVVAVTVATMVQAMVTPAKITVVEDVETVAKNAADAETVEAGAEPVEAHTIMVVVITPIMTVTKSAATKIGDNTAGRMGIAPINPINVTLPPTVTKARQRSQIRRTIAP